MIRTHGHTDTPRSKLRPVGTRRATPGGRRWFERLTDATYEAFAFVLAVPWWARHLLVRGLVARERLTSELAPLRERWPDVTGSANGVAFLAQSAGSFNYASCNAPACALTLGSEP